MTDLGIRTVHPEGCLCDECMSVPDWLKLQRGERSGHVGQGVVYQGTGGGSAGVRSFETGATRSVDTARPDPEGFLSPIVIERYCEYMNKHRLQPDGSTRTSDNWQKGMTPESYMKGLCRHQLHAWTRHRGYIVLDPGAAGSLEEDLCAIIFNASGYLFELLKGKRK